MSQAVASARQESTAEPKALATTRRLWEVDAWRGVAIVTMVIFHLVYDLWAFARVPIVLTQGFWFYFQRFTATSFIVIVGVSLVISYSRAQQRKGGADGLYWKYFKRGLKILGVGVAIGIVTRLGGFGRDDFGVLHLIGTAIILAYPFLCFRWLNLVLAAGLFALSYYFQTLTVQSSAWVWLGIVPPNYYSVDYFPLTHWFAVVLIGIFIGNTLYKNGKRQFTLPDLSPFFPFNLLQFLGRHSLTIYVVHQPILMAILIATGVVHFGF